MSSCFFFDYLSFCKYPISLSPEKSSFHPAAYLKEMMNHLFEKIQKVVFYAIQLLQKTFYFFRERNIAKQSQKDIYVEIQNKMVEYSTQHIEKVFAADLRAENDKKTTFEQNLKHLFSIYQNDFPDAVVQESQKVKIHQNKLVQENLLALLEHERKMPYKKIVILGEMLEEQIAQSSIATNLFKQNLLKNLQDLPCSENVRHTIEFLISMEGFIYETIFNSNWHEKELPLFVQSYLNQGFPIKEVTIELNSQTEELILSNHVNFFYQNVDTQETFAKVDFCAQFSFSKEIAKPKATFDYRITYT